MAQTQYTVSDLLRLLQEKGKSKEYIIEVLETIIKTHTMYGTRIQDSIDYQVFEAKKVKD